jgi:DNA excision repair protein ERCC-2
VDNKRIQVSIRGLVEYVFRTGSIDLRFRTSMPLTEGTKAHQKLQSTYRDTDEKEVPLRTEIDFNGYRYEVEGRCDGLLYDHQVVTIDEIKSTSTDLLNLPEDGYEVHWAQAKFYAYIFLKNQDKQMETINVRLTYYQIETEEIRQLMQTYRFEELERFVMEVISQFAPFAELRYQHKVKRNESIRLLSFPFEQFRQGQRKLAGAVYKTIVDQKNLFAMAPTGIGKTISTTFPAVKAIGEEKIEKIFYLTAKTITRQAAEEAFTLMQQQGLCINTVTITAKEKACLKEETICQKDYCEFANGYYDRLNEALMDIFKNEKAISRTVIEEYARKHTICPFEFSLDLAYAADAIICDYNYVFDPRISLKRLLEDQKKQTVILVDEAHNLVDRAREMFSSELNKSSFLALKKEFQSKNNPLSLASKVVNDGLLAFKKQVMANVNPIIEDGPSDEFLAALEGFKREAELELLKRDSSESDTMLLETYFLVQNFQRIHKLYDQRFTTYLEMNKSEVKLRLFCLDPSFQLQQMAKGYRSFIFFSATLTPIDYYQNLLGAKADDYLIGISSPFSSEQTEFHIEPLSTRYNDREQTKEKIVNLLVAIVEGRKGNFLIFFPSYQYMMLVYEAFKERNLNIDILLQEQGMSEEERETFLQAFQPNKSRTLLGFAVLGGIFSEGVDLKGDRLNGVIVVGVGLPQIGLERDLIKDYFLKTGKSGFDYAYVYPGINKVLQAGGRLIRSEEDRGLIILIDDRFLQPKYQKLLPTEWKASKKPNETLTN